MMKNVLMTIAVFLLLTVSAESVLRLSGYTYYPDDIGFHPTPNYQMFHRVGEVYRNLKGDTFSAEKKENELRVFVFGGSSIQYISLEPLREQLQAHFPNRHVTMLNCGYGSWGTTRLLLLFREMITYDPDLLIVYSGHNEFEEQYVKDIFYRDNWLTDLNEKLLSFSKVYQFLNMLVRAGMMYLAKMGVIVFDIKREPVFAPAFDDITSDALRYADRAQVYVNYKKNLTQMVRLAKAQNIPIVISTVAYSRIWPPMCPANTRHEEGMVLLKRGHYADGRALLEHALVQDQEIRRANEESNAIVKAVAHMHAVPVADVDAHIVAAAPHNIPGLEDDETPQLLADYCHLAPSGNAIMLSVLSETVSRAAQKRKWFL